MEKQLFLHDLQQKIEEHQTAVADTYRTLPLSTLNWQPNPTEWSVLQCFEHLNLTYDYYYERIHPVHVALEQIDPSEAVYKPSFWGRIYMHFSLNPKFTFPAPDEVIPAQTLDFSIFDRYKQQQTRLLDLLEITDRLPLSDIRIPIKSFVKFNLGDCLKVLVYHDALHMGQADRVLAQLS